MIPITQKEINDCYFEESQMTSRFIQSIKKAEREFKRRE